MYTSSRLIDVVGVARKAADLSLRPVGIKAKYGALILFVLISSSEAPGFLPVLISRLRCRHALLPSTIR